MLARGNILAQTRAINVIAEYTLTELYFMGALVVDILTKSGDIIHLDEVLRGSSFYLLRLVSEPERECTKSYILLCPWSRRK
jgi:hypothetical protein